jgi:hypothetical protein
MTAQEVFELTSQGGATDFTEVVQLCRSLGPYCLIGGLAVNCYVEAVYTMDADLALVPSALADLPSRLQAAGFSVETFPHSINAQRGSSQLRIQFTRDVRYGDFPARAQQRNVLGEMVAVASLDDVFQGKLWAWSDSGRRLTKRKKDELDLLRLAEAYPALRDKLPTELRSILF